MILAATVWLEVRSFIAVPAVLVCLVLAFRLASGAWARAAVIALAVPVVLSEQSRLPPFSPDDVRAMDLGMALAPGVVDPISRRCVAMR